MVEFLIVAVCVLTFFVAYLLGRCEKLRRRLERIAFSSFGVGETPNDAALDALDRCQRIAREALGYPAEKPEASGR